MAENLGRIGVIGPGIVGAPMAALLARAAQAGTYGPDAHVRVVQRNSKTSGWKVAAFNRGESPIGGIEPGLEEIIKSCVDSGHLSASHDPRDLSEADVVLICVQTDKVRDGSGHRPDYGPMYGAIDELAPALAARKNPHPALVVIESTLAPSSMATVIRDRFASHGCIEGEQVRLGNSPNRVMPGRLVERIALADKLAGGLHPDTPRRIAELYTPIVTQGTMHQTNALTAEVVKTLENTYRDVRIAYAHEVVRYCDAVDVDFFALRDRVNEAVGREDDASGDGAVVPVAALLVPTVGVGGHCLPKDGILMRWQFDAQHPDGPARSLIHAARDINDDAPDWTRRRAAALFGDLAGEKVALLGLAYRGDSDDTRNSPTFQLAESLLANGSEVAIHDPYVRPTDHNLGESGLLPVFHRDDLDEALRGAAVAIVCQPHKRYRDAGPALFVDRGLRGVFDAANVYRPGALTEADVPNGGIGRGTRAPDAALVDAVVAGFRAVETGFANELAEVVDHLNAHYAPDDFTRISLDTVRALAATCATGCDVVAPGPVPDVALPAGLDSELLRRARQ